MSRRNRRKRASAEGFSLSFLDAISCGFGAIVILLVLTKIGEPRALEDAKKDLEARVSQLEQELTDIREKTQLVTRDVTTREEQLSIEQAQIARLRGDLSKIQGEFASSRQLSEIQEILEGRMLAAQQELSEEMKRLLGRNYRRPVEDATVGGIPVDSEYVIFVIDTSGSMYTNAWPLVVQKMQEVLAIYPKVKGIQVMNDMGRYMFASYAGKWIPDTPSRRRVIVERLRNWNAFSNSSPVEGVTRAIRNFAADDKKISIYVFGDEFTGGSVEEVLTAVGRYNKKDAEGNPRVRVHAIGFPTIFAVPGVGEKTGVRFATLMRVLTQENGGTFVGLNTIVP
ncbi:MAG: VWA domain-containing protein [bacterium]|nr:VWA domain-containing protein [bacterium]